MGSSGEEVAAELKRVRQSIRANLDAEPESVTFTAHPLLLNHLRRLAAEAGITGDPTPEEAP